MRTFRMIRSAALAALVAGCGGGGDDDGGLDPTGAWAMDVVYGAGSCGQDGNMFQAMFTVSAAEGDGGLGGGGDYEVVLPSIADLQDLETSIACEADSCSASIDFTIGQTTADGYWTLEQVWSLELDAAGMISGGGEDQYDTNLADDEPCTQAFTATGQLTPGGAS